MYITTRPHCNAEEISNYKSSPHTLPPVSGTTIVQCPPSYTLNPLVHHQQRQEEENRAYAARVKEWEAIVDRTVIGKRLCCRGCVVVISFFHRVFCFVHPPLGFQRVPFLATRNCGVLFSLTSSTVAQSRS